MSKIKISYFDNVGDTKPKSIDLDVWLRRTIEPPKDLKKQIVKYRNLRSANLKRKIPCATISASFKKVRNLDHIKKKTNLICLDIDRFAKSKTATCNLCIDFDLVKDVLSQFSACMYVGYSVSSDGDAFKDGMYAIIKTHKKDSLIKCFEFYKEKLQRIGINIDESCKDYTRLRFMSYDPNAFYNPEAVAFRVPKKQKPKKSKIKGNASKTDFEKVNAIIELIEANAVDITSNYEDWFRIAGAFNVAFGENGRAFFHRISRFHHAYNEKKTDSKYNNCSNMNKLSLSTFFHIANDHGIRY